MLIHNKDDIQLVTEFPCLLGHPVLTLIILVVAEYIESLVDSTVGCLILEHFKKFYF